MAISEVCQFELKEEVDKLHQRNPELSIAECIRQVLEFYASAGIEVKEETARTKYKRASAVGSNEPTPSTTSNNNENRPRCSCGNLAKRSKDRKDGSKAYLPKCDLCYKNQAKQKTDYVPQPQILTEEQVKIWKIVNDKLQELAKYMMEHCNADMEINRELKDKLLNALDTITIIIRRGK